MEIKPKLKIFFLFLLFGLIVNGLLWYIIWKKFPPSDIPYTIHYSIIQGADVFGTKNNLFVIPLVGLTISAINIVLSWFLQKKEPFVSYLLSAMSLFVNCFLLIALFGLLKFNGQI